MRFHSTTKDVCDCEADVTQMSAVVQSHRRVNGVDQRVRSQYVRHYRARDDAHFWHWRDQRKRMK